MDSIEKWTKDSSRKTQQDVFLEQWPNAARDRDGILNICPKLLDVDISCTDDETERTGLCKACDDCQHEFWMQERDGRMVVLPCKVGDTVYFRTYDCNGTVDLGIQPHKVTAIVGRAIVSGRYTDAVLLPGQYGVSWFLTREEAEKALEAMKK